MKIVKLESIVDILDNLRQPINSTERSIRIGKIPYYGATGQVGTIDKAIFNESLLLLGEDGVPFFDRNKHKAYEISGPSWVNNHAHVLRAKPSLVKQKYLLYFLNNFNYSGYVNGATRLKLTQGDMKRIPVPLPPLMEQETIVEKLDKTFAEIDSLEKNLQLKEEKTNQLLQSMLSAAFTNTEEFDMKVVKLGEVFKFQNGRAFKKGEWKESGIPIIRIQNLNSERAGFNYFTGDYDERIMINSGDLLFSWSGTVGTSFGPHIWKGPQALLNQHIFKVQTSESIDRQYAYLSLLNITKEIENNVSGAVGLVHIKKSKLTEFLIPLPSINAQKMTVEKLDKAFSEIDKLKNQISIEKDRISSLRQSILSNAFSFPEKVA